MEKTPIPAVFIHGTLGWGRKTPFFNLAPDYWPIQHLDEINPNYIIVEVGIASSDHDRACETFYQLVGGRVDYGTDHAAEKGHLQYGTFFDTALHPQWSEEYPVHLIGHSYGATTALELYQLICTDFFGIGSNYKWVKSIVSISGTLSGTTITPMLGCEVGKPSPFGTVSYIIACGFSTLYKLQLHFPWLNRIYDLRMPQWSTSVSWSTLYNTSYKPLNTDDNVFTCLMPQHRLEKNRLLVHMDKIHLFSIVSQTENALSFPLVEVASVASMLALWKLKQPKVWICLLSLFLWRRLHVTDWSTRSLFLGWLLKRHAETTPVLFDGFDKDRWQHSDGIVNSYSMIRPRLSVDEELKDRNSLERVPSHISIDMDHDHSFEIPKGQWHIYRVAKNHLCGTRGDGDARELYLRLFRMLNQLST